MNAFNQNIQFNSPCSWINSENSHSPCSWSEFMGEILSMCNATEKRVVHSSANTLYKFYTAKCYSAQDCLMFIRGGRI